MITFQVRSGERCMNVRDFDEPHRTRGCEDTVGARRLSVAASALRRNIRDSYGAVLCNPRVSFALVDLLLDLSATAERGLLDHVVRTASIRAARAISQVEEQRLGSLQLARCACSSRHIRISAELLAAGPITCGLCGHAFVATMTATITPDQEDFVGRRRTRSKGSIERSP